ncbi:hypothetical protein AB0F77_24745 [Streptomyces sp. NPDC026672]|uniref:hypothetical protein n=1 Tax=unclassified Streptomyces TaxID=2593676 RepID=UPI00340DEE61
MSRHHHHKSNSAVEGDPDHGHSRGMPRRPDDDELARRTAYARREAGLEGPPEEESEAGYRDEW